MKKTNPTSKRRTQNAVGSDALVRLDLMRNGKYIRPVEADETRAAKETPANR